MCALKKSRLCTGVGTYLEVLVGVGSSGPSCRFCEWHSDEKLCYLHDFLILFYNLGLMA